MREIQEGCAKTAKKDDNWSEICDRMHASIENNGDVPISRQVRIDLIEGYMRRCQ